MIPDIPHTIDKQVLLSLKAGDEEAFTIVYQQLSGKLYGSLCKLVKSREIAGELLQEAFLKIWEKRHLIDPDKPFQAYLFRIAENLAFDFFRRMARDKKLQRYMIGLVAETSSNVEELYINKEYNNLLQQAIEALPPRRREIFRLCKLDGKSYEEVASQLELSTTTISDHIVRATRFIKKYCNAYHDFLLVVSLLTVYPAT